MLLSDLTSIRLPPLKSIPKFSPLIKREKKDIRQKIIEINNVTFLYLRN
jgi:hypothetical protein